MPSTLTPRQLTGLDDSHLVTLADGHRLQAEVAQAFAALQAAALTAGFELAIASSFRPFSRQLAIWNGKASGARPVHDDAGRAVSMAALSAREKLHAILRFSAIPGTSRHHWGTDLDVYDAAAMPLGYPLQLSPPEVATGGLFDPLHCWLDERMAAGESHGFYRPYASDRGGVAPERWHLSYAPLSVVCAQGCDRAVLAACWQCDDSADTLLLREEIEKDLDGLLARYVHVPEGWCPPP
ncbi:MAG: M15 family metallopeptidase [Halioglobus sp.]|nr:M15 family metallopeptidase [Halioglobus sp.]